MNEKCDKCGRFDCSGKYQRYNDEDEWDYRCFEQVEDNKESEIGGYEKAVNKLMEDCQIDMSIEGDNLIDFKTKLEALAIAEGERRANEKNKCKSPCCQNCEWNRAEGRKQALKEVEELIDKLPTQSLQTYDYETESVVFVDELKQAIDQLRNKGEK